MLLAVSKIGPALAAGCTLVVKPSPPATVLDCYILAEAAEAAQLPPGVINWIPGGREVGAHLVATSLSQALQICVDEAKAHLAPTRQKATVE